MAGLEQTPLIAESTITPGLNLPSSPSPDNNQVSLDETHVRNVLRKVDGRLLPLMFMTYLLSFADKLILSGAAVFGLLEDTVCMGI